MFCISLSWLCRYSYSFLKPHAENAGSGLVSVIQWTLLRNSSEGHFTRPRKLYNHCQSLFVGPSCLVDSCGTFVFLNFCHFLWRVIPSLLIIGCGMAATDAHNSRWKFKASFSTCAGWPSSGCSWSSRSPQNHYWLPDTHNTSSSGYWWSSWACHRKVSFSSRSRFCSTASWWTVV